MSYNVIIEKILKDITVSKGGKAVFTFGRMNPPTLGHEMLISKVIEIGMTNNIESFIILSKKSDPKKNPIPYLDKITALDKALPGVNFIDNERIVNIFDAVQFLTSRGYKDLIMVCGSDRVDSYNTMFEPYKDHPEEEKRLGYNSLQVVSAGERDPDSDEISGISGTKARKYVLDDDYESFKKILPTGMPADQAQILFNDIKQNYKPAVPRKKKFKTQAS